MKEYYQIMRHRIDSDGLSRFSFAIHKVAIDGDEVLWTEAQAPYGDTPDELMQDLANMAKDAMSNGMRDFDTGEIL